MGQARGGHLNYRERRCGDQLGLPTRGLQVMNYFQGIGTNMILGQKMKKQKSVFSMAVELSAEV